MIDLLENIFNELSIECYHISKEERETYGDYIIYNFSSRDEKFSNNKVDKVRYTVYLNYYIVDGTTLEKKKTDLVKKLREYRILSRGTDNTYKESTGYYNTSLSFYYYK